MSHATKCSIVFMAVSIMTESENNVQSSLELLRSNQVVSIQDKVRSVFSPQSCVYVQVRMEKVMSRVLNSKCIVTSYWVRSRVSETSQVNSQYICLFHPSRRLKCKNLTIVLSKVFNMCFLIHILCLMYKCRSCEHPACCFFCYIASQIKTWIT